MVRWPGGVGMERQAVWGWSDGQGRAFRAEVTHLTGTSLYGLPSARRRPAPLLLF